MVSYVLIVINEASDEALVLLVVPSTWAQLLPFAGIVFQILMRVY